LPDAPGVDPSLRGRNNGRAWHRNYPWTLLRPEIRGIVMNDFNRKVEEASARMKQSVAQATERLEKETAELITYLNDEVVPAVRQHSTKALRVAAEKMSKLADYLDEVKSNRR